MRSDLPFAPALATQRQYEGTMPTFVKMVTKLEEPAEFFGDDFRGVALFCGIELVLTLIAVSNGVQGVWL
jgi:hypothetical protein